MYEHEYWLATINEENTFIVPNCIRKIVAQHIPGGIGRNLCTTATNEPLGVSIWHSVRGDGTLEVDVVNCIGCSYHQKNNIQ